MYDCIEFPGSIPQVTRQGYSCAKEGISELLKNPQKEGYLSIYISKEINCHLAWPDWF